MTLSQTFPFTGALNRPDLELLFGDPHIDGPFNYAAIAADDDARRMNTFAEGVLDAWGAAAEFVPAALGGRWTDTSAMVTRLRPIFRRDPAVGLGYGLTTLMAAVNVWIGGDEEQQADLAMRLLRGERIATAFHELDHGNDLLHNECTADFGGGVWKVRGAKQIINNIDRAESVLIMARTSEGVVARQFSLLLWHKAPGDPVDTTRRVLTAGMRGCWIGAAQFDGVKISARRIIGSEGNAVATALKAFQITRATIPALAVGSLEAALHETILYARDRQLYGGSVLDIPHARSLYADALTDTLIADALSGSVVRALHLAPRESFVLSAVAKYLAPQLLMDAIQQLSVLAGSTFYARTEPYSILEKLVRDLIVVPIGHAGSTSCLMTILPNLPVWARRSERTVEADLRLFELNASEELPALDFQALSLGAGSTDSLGAALHDPRVRQALAQHAPQLLPLVYELAEGFKRERAIARALSPDQLTAESAAASFDVARRVSLFFAAAAILGSCAVAAGTSDLAADPLVVEACLERVRGRLAHQQRPLRREIIDRLVDHGEWCVDESRSVGLRPVTIYPKARQRVRIPAGNREGRRGT
ncbi:acyl-CoA dehydrogenase [Micromonospora sp. DT81.3]|uniref:acyl-CoA dehydrogenase n=1 Tax=Micromonospora sp. DT81.3 TaxID=3416523 RepID=UPI003CFB697F